MTIKHVIVLNIVGLEPKHLKGNQLPVISALADDGIALPMKPSFPCVTCSVQASILCGTYPDEHGIIANGLYDRNTYSVSFWEQASSLVQRERIWDILKRGNPSLKTAVLFWQNSMYANSDIIITPRPLHLENETVMWCYSKPVGYYEKVSQVIGEFDLMSYWGPLASSKSSEWITAAAEYTLETQKPNLLLVYIPHIDYSAQRFGKDSAQVAGDLKIADELVGKILKKLQKLGIEKESAIILLSEYAFNNVNKVIPLNLILRDNGLVSVREIKGQEYLDLEHSNAFAMVDHQIAHIYIKSKSGKERQVKDILENVKSIYTLLDEEGKQKYRINNARSGELVAVADEDAWFNYYWWYDIKNAPRFARTVDIHRKPGYDPLELFLDPKTRTISLDTSQLKGSHGRPATGKEGLTTIIINTKINHRHRQQEEIFSSAPVDITQVTPTIATMFGIKVDFLSGPILNINR